MKILCWMWVKPGPIPIASSNSSDIDRGIINNIVTLMIRRVDPRQVTQQYRYR